MFCGELLRLGDGVGAHIRKVSKEWQQLCFDGQLWAELDASKYHDRIPVEQLAQLIVSAGPFVRNLNLR